MNSYSYFYACSHIWGFNTVMLTYIQASKRQETLLPCDIVHKECLPKILDQPVFHTYRCKYSFFIMFDIPRA